MGLLYLGIEFAAPHFVRLTLIALAVLLACNAASRAEEKTIPPCREDGIPNSRARIDEARSALARVLPNAPNFGALAS
jgi:hypothetical protein